ncbi:MAG TPA: superoxide dismutase family protein [Patescibacteria group bacterium]|nr:superoxide dismutase family protein [Patescibacteria group bacterium]
MKNTFAYRISLLALALAAALGPFRASATMTLPPAGVTAISSSSPELTGIILFNNNRAETGRAAVTEAPKGMLVQLEVRGLMTGWYGVHIHGVGDCSDVATFSSAGPPLALAGQDHGYLNANGPQNGDLPNIWVGQDGTGRAQFFTTLLTSQMLHVTSGAAIVIYQSEDDFKANRDSQPGKRIACGVIVPKK